MAVDQFDRRDLSADRITERVRTRLAASPAQPAATTLGHATSEIALLRDEHRAEARIWLAFVAQAAVSELLAGPLRTSYAALQNLFVRLITEAAERGSLNPQHEACTLLALADGLTIHVLIGHLTTEEAEKVLRAHLAGLWERPRTTGPREAV